MNLENVASGTKRAASEEPAAAPKRKAAKKGKGKKPAAAVAAPVNVHLMGASQRLKLHNKESTGPRGKLLWYYNYWTPCDTAKYCET